MKQISGGVTAAKGFKAAGLHVGVKTSNTSKKDLALIVSDCLCTAAAVYTKNVVKAAPIYQTMGNLKNGHARAVVCNSGNANACAPQGAENALRMCRSAAAALNIDPSDVIVASTGVIGAQLKIEVIENGMAQLAAALSENGSADAEAAIMTTDLRQKEIAVSLDIGGKEIRIGAIAKGSGMIHPNMGTMLSFVTTDAAITSEMLREALLESTVKTYNRVCVDGDTSTNDMCAVLANGLAQNTPIINKNDDYKAFTAGLNFVNEYMAKCIARDGEGATKLVICRAINVKTEESAEKLSKQVIKSSLVKAAMFGNDANWGRILCAMGYSETEFEPGLVDVSFKSAAGEIMVCKQGAGLSFDEALARSILTQEEVEIIINLGEGSCEATCWGCDLTYDYVKINGDYRT